MGFSVNTCLPSLNRRFEMLRTVPRRRRQHDDVDVGVNHLLKRIETDEVMFGIHLDAWLHEGDQVLGAQLHRLAIALHRDAGVAFETNCRVLLRSLFQRALELILEDVGHRDQFDILVALSADSPLPVCRVRRIRRCTGLQNDRLLKPRERAP